MSAEKSEQVTSRPANAASVPDVSIVIASWNGRSHLLNCLNAIEALGDGIAREIIVVDNASSAGGRAARDAPRLPALDAAEVMLSGAHWGFAGFWGGVQGSGRQ